MSETAKVYCTVILLLALFIIVVHLFVRFFEYIVDKLFVDQELLKVPDLDETDYSYSSDTVDCLTEEYIRSWIHSPSNGVKCGDSVFVHMIREGAYLVLLDTPKSGLFQRKRKVHHHLVVNLAVRNHNTFEFERIHSITCRSLSPELETIEHGGKWYTYDISLVS